MPLPLHRSLYHSIKNFPKFVIEYIGGFVVALLSDINTVSFALTGASIGWVTHSVAIAVASFLLIYSLARIALVAAS